MRRMDYTEVLVAVPEEPEVERYIAPAEKKIYYNISARRGANVDRIVGEVTPPRSSAV